MAQQPLGDWGGHTLLLLPRDLYVLAIITAIAVSFPFAALLCLTQ